MRTGQSPVWIFRYRPPSLDLGWGVLRLSIPIWGRAKHTIIDFNLTKEGGAP